MALTWRIKLLAARARRRVVARRGEIDREEVMRRHAPGKSVCDVGCMWKVHGRIAFVAEDAGATAVTGVDVFGPTPEFENEHRRRGSRVRFVLGDLHERGTVEEVGPHQVVWCAGLLYHSPNPLLALTRLRELTTELLILQTTVLPELPAVRHGVVFYPGLPPGERASYDLWGPEARAGFAAASRDDASYASWWWGITPSALRAMLRTAGFEPREEWGDPFGLHVVAAPV